MRHAASHVVIALATLLSAPACRHHAGAAAVREAKRAKGVIPDTEVSINGISPGDSAVRVRGVLGRPDSVTSPRRGISDIIFQTAYYPDLEVEYADGTVAYLTCHTQRCRTRAGFTIGSQRTAIEKHYGAPTDPYPGTWDPATKAFYDGVTHGCGLSFDYSGLAATKVEIWCDLS
jgi:hypothetical protein